MSSGCITAVWFDFKFHKQTQNLWKPCPVPESDETKNCKSGENTTVDSGLDFPRLLPYLMFTRKGSGASELKSRHWCVVGQVIWTRICLQQQLTTISLEPSFGSLLHRASVLQKGLLITFIIVRGCHGSLSRGHITCLRETSFTQFNLSATPTYWEKKSTIVIQKHAKKYSGPPE